MRGLTALWCQHPHDCHPRRGRCCCAEGVRRPPRALVQASGELGAADRAVGVRPEPASVRPTGPASGAAGRGRSGQGAPARRRTRALTRQGPLVCRCRHRPPLGTSLPADKGERRAWELRHTVTAYDASYVAVAEMLGGMLLTLDGRLARGRSEVPCPGAARRVKGRAGPPPGTREVRPVSASRPPATTAGGLCPVAIAPPAPTG